MSPSHAGTSFAGILPAQNLLGTLSNESARHATVSVLINPLMLGKGDRISVAKQFIMDLWNSRIGAFFKSWIATALLKWQVLATSAPAEPFTKLHFPA
jgi:hypothetical protein